MKVDIKKKDGKWTVEFWQGVQSFNLDYRGSKKEMLLMARMLNKAFENYRQEIIKKVKKEET